MSYATGALVTARGRDWVVLPESKDDWLHLRPLGGSQHEVTAIHTDLEQVSSATFPLPDPDRELGDSLSCRLLRDAVRLGFRSSAGPFRSFASLGVDPRPYQLVPLLMALRQETVRLLISDDVGIGKTIEAGLIAKELLERGEINRMAVLCPPHLAEQWKKELHEKFHIDAELVLSSTVKRLEKNCLQNESVFQRYPFVIVSLDYIKTDARRFEFSRSCPEFVIIDEAHTCAYAVDARRSSSQQKRHQLIRDLADDENRHMVLVTATPHNGKPDVFRSLLGILDQEFLDYPDDLQGDKNRKRREKLARYFVQRRRANILDYLDENTVFPGKETRSHTYRLSGPYRKFTDQVIDYATEQVLSSEGDDRRQRIMEWSAISLFRALSSSPRAAAKTLENRAKPPEELSTKDIDQRGQVTVIEAEDPEDEISDNAMRLGDDREDAKVLMKLAEEAGKFEGKKDTKLQELLVILKSALKDGHSPIVFCRYIQTAEYLCDHLRVAFKKTEIQAVTGRLNPEEREQRVRELGKHDSRILVCTDCLSEGINLQDKFNAVIHYDLCWTPTQLEQREGRVDRYGQKHPTVRLVTYHGADSAIDRKVRDILLEKSQKIFSALGIAVSFQESASEDVRKGLLELVYKKKEEANWAEQGLITYDEVLKREEEERKARAREQAEELARMDRRSRAMFAQESIKVEEVKRELTAAREAIGSGVDLREFTRTALSRMKAVVKEGDQDRLRVNLKDTTKGFKDYLGIHDDELQVGFEMPVPPGTLYCNRTHPMVERLSTWVMDASLDQAGSPQEGALPVSARCGVMRTEAVSTRTTLLVLRMRYQIIRIFNRRETPMLAEECLSIAFKGAPGKAASDASVWLEQPAVDALAKASASGNLEPAEQREHLAKILKACPELTPTLMELADKRKDMLLESHLRVKKESGIRSGDYRVEASPPDILALYLYLPGGSL